MGSISTSVNETALQGTLFTEAGKLAEPRIDLSQYRSLFPLVEREDVTYINASFQMPTSTKVKQAIDHFSELGVHSPTAKETWQATAVQTKELLADFLHVPHDSLAFVRDTTEALNLFQRSVKFLPGNNVVILDNEHPNNAYGWLALAEQGLEVRRIPTGADTFADASTFAPYVDDRTVAVSISSVMFHSGQKNDVKSLSREFRPRGIHVLVDVTQHVGFSPVDLTDMGVSGAAFSCHKGLGCPTGLGVLYIDPTAVQTLKKTPAIVGAGAISNLRGDLIADDDVQYHSTTLRYEHLNKSLVSAAALQASLRLLHEQIGMQNVEQHLRSLGQELGRSCTRIGIPIVGSQYVEQRSAHSYILQLLHPDWATHFRENGIYVSHYRCGTRVSFGIYNNLEDVAILVKSLERGMDKGIPAR